LKWRVEATATLVRVSGNGCARHGVALIALFKRGRAIAYFSTLRLLSVLLLGVVFLGAANKFSADAGIERPNSMIGRGSSPEAENLLQFNGLGVGLKIGMKIGKTVVFCVSFCYIFNSF
jgi:hypothetical protein